MVPVKIKLGLNGEYIFHPVPHINQQQFFILKFTVTIFSLFFSILYIFRPYLLYLRCIVVLICKAHINDFFFILLRQEFCESWVFGEKIHHIYQNYRYCAPATVLAYLYIRTSRELRPPEGPLGVMMFEHRADVRNRQRYVSNMRLYT